MSKPNPTNNRYRYRFTFTIVVSVPPPRFLAMLGVKPAEQRIPFRSFIVLTRGQAGQLRHYLGALLEVSNLRIEGLKLSEGEQVK